MALPSFTVIVALAITLHLVIPSSTNLIRKCSHGGFFQFAELVKCLTRLAKATGSKCRRGRVPGDLGWKLDLIPKFLDLLCHLYLNELFGSNKENARGPPLQI